MLIVFFVSHYFVVHCFLLLVWRRKNPIILMTNMLRFRLTLHFAVIKYIFKRIEGI